MRKKSQPSAPAQSPRTDGPRRYSLIDPRFLDDRPRRRRRPDWIGRESLAVVNHHEPLFYRRRAGQAQVGEESIYRYEHSEELVQRVVDQGGHILIAAFEKNHRIDEEYFPAKRQLGAFCRKHGLRFGVYIRADQLYTECFADRLKEEDLLARRPDGQAPSYGHLEWRRCVCFHQPAILRMFKASIRRAVEDLKVDVLHLDGFIINGTETRGACRCKNCRRDFTKFLKRRYGDDPVTCECRFGHTRLDAIEPPGLVIAPAMPTGRVSDPVWQEWIAFRCTWSARVARIVAEYTYELNPEVAIMANCSLAVRENAALLAGFDIPSVGSSLDVIMNEDAFSPEIMADGRILQRARQHKMVQNAGCWLWTYMQDPNKPDRDLRVRLAHAAAFNAGRVTSLGSADGHPEKKNFTRWLDDHWEHFQNLETISDVVVWRNSAAMALADPLAYATAMRLEQLLIEDRIPFNIAFNEWPADSRAVVLPGLAGLDDVQCASVIEFVRRGGGALIVGPTSAMDGWNRQRGDFGLRAILPETVRIPGSSGTQPVANANVPVEPGQPQFPGKDLLVYHAASTGRVVYVPEVVDPASQPSLFNPDNTYNFSLDTTNWTVPKNADALRRALAWLLGNRPTAGVEAERGVLANYYRQARTGRFYGHLVNLRDKPVFNPVLNWTVAESQTITGVTVLSPDGPDTLACHWQVSGTRLMVELDRLDVYSVIMIQTR